MFIYLHKIYNTIKPTIKHNKELEKSLEKAECIVIYNFYNYIKK